MIRSVPVLRVDWHNSNSKVSKEVTIMLNLEYDQDKKEKNNLFKKE